MSRHHRVMRTKARSCTGKVRHPDRATAENRIRALRKLGRVRLGAYPCRFCGGWHIGHQPKPRT